MSEEISEESTENVSRRLRSILESLLFAVAEPVSLGRLAEVLPGYERKEIQKALEALAEEYQNEERGFRLHPVGGGYQLRTARANADYVKGLLQKRPVRLTRASLETLAVVAYRQPVTRAEIEAIRGVDVDAVLNTLLDRRLIKVAGRKEVVGRPLLYATTPEFLETFSLKDLNALPTLEELGESADVFERATARLEAAGLLEEGEGAANADVAGDEGATAGGAADEVEGEGAPGEPGRALHVVTDSPEEETVGRPADEEEPSPKSE